MAQARSARAINQREKGSVTYSTDRENSVSKRYLFDLFFFACFSVFTQVGPSVPKIFRDDFLHANGTICARDI